MLLIRKYNTRVGGVTHELDEILGVEIHQAPPRVIFYLATGEEVAYEPQTNADAVRIAKQLEETGRVTLNL